MRYLGISAHIHPYALLSSLVFACLDHLLSGSHDQAPEVFHLNASTYLLFYPSDFEGTPPFNACTPLFFNFMIAFSPLRTTLAGSVFKKYLTPTSRENLTCFLTTGAFFLVVENTLRAGMSLIGGLVLRGAAQARDPEGAAAAAA